MFKMFAILCVLSSADCRVMHEDPPRVYDTREQCEAQAVIRLAETRAQLEGVDYRHLDVGCEPAGSDT